MLSKIEAHRAAGLLLHRFGEVAIAAALLRAQEARAAGRIRRMLDWYRIADAAAARADVDAPPAAA